MCARARAPAMMATAQEFIGRGELAERQQRIGKVLATCKELGEIFVRCARTRPHARARTTMCVCVL